MAKYSKKQNQTSEKTQQEAEALAKGIKKPGQTKEQTKLISQGIAKGIDLYKKQQKAKARDQDKAQKKAAKIKSAEIDSNVDQTENTKSSIQPLPWFLLVVTWLGIGAYAFLQTN